MGNSDSRSLNFWTLDEYKQFIQTMEPGTRYYLMFEMLFWTGCRIGELLAITKADINFEKNPTKEQLIEKLESFKGFPQEAELPSAPKQFIRYMTEDNRPQVKLDVDYENGMGISIGRLREDSLYDYKFIGLSLNTVRGAAGGAVLCAETLTAKGFITKK